MRIYRSDKNKITLKAIEKYRYGLPKTVSKHLKNKINKNMMTMFKNLSYARFKRRATAVPN